MHATPKNPLSNSSPFLILHVREQEFEAITQSPHILVRNPPQLERAGDDLDVPVLDLGVLPVFEAEEEVAGVLGVDAEVVDGPFGIGFRVGGQPAFCSVLISIAHMNCSGISIKSYQYPLCFRSDTSHAASSHRPCEP